MIPFNSQRFNWHLDQHRFELKVAAPYVALTAAGTLHRLTTPIIIEIPTEDSRWPLLTDGIYKQHDHFI